MYKQHAPYAVQIELSQGCNLGCDFCGIHAIGYQKMNRGTDTMKVEVAQSIADQMRAARWSPRIEFAMHGEPTLHPVIDVMIGVFRKALPRAFIMVTSNGGGLLAGGAQGTNAKINAMFDAGLNTLALDNYENVNIVPKVVERYTGDVPIKHYPADRSASPHARHRGKLISVVKDISVADDGTHSTLNNHAGSAAPLNDKAKGKRCAKPFREMSIRWDGNVAICCNDWPGIYRCGNVVKDGLLNVWHGEAFVAARQMLLLGRREMAPCKGCDATSYRVGLLPDPKGVESMPKPNAKTQEAIKRALAKGPYTKPVRPVLDYVKE